MKVVVKAMLKYAVGVLLIAVNITDAISTNVAVNELGIASGKLEESKWTERKFYSFKGIPFAEPPIGNRRYAPPVRVNSWADHHLDATEFKNICPQTKQAGYDVEGYDEDCLHVNVYVPADAKAPLPVMIWLHGGEYISGHAQRYQPHYLMEADVILVVPQFRLGPLGLLSLDNEEIPGNVQFLDQVMAMEWVRDNIGCFGGDRNSVTLFGQSSGAYSVNLHLLSPLSQGLFHRTIMQSMSVYSPGQIDRNPVRSATEIARVLGCNVQTIGNITQCMKTLTAKSILQGFDRYMAENSANERSRRGGARAVIQRPGAGRFLTAEPIVLTANGKFLQLPTIGGVTQQDGSLLVSGIYDLLSATGLLEDAEFLTDKLIPTILKHLAIEDETGALSQLLIDKYFPNVELTDFSKMVPGLTDMGSVLIFKAGVHRMARENSHFQPTYLYTFDYRGNQTRFGYESGIEYPFDGGVAHSDDNMYLFPFPDKLTAEDKSVARSLVQLWTNFATTGTPSADGVKAWPRMSTRNGPYLKIGAKSTTGDNFLDEYTITIRNGTVSPSELWETCLYGFWKWLEYL